VVTTPTVFAGSTVHSGSIAASDLSVL